MEEAGTEGQQAHDALGRTETQRQGRRETWRTTVPQPRRQHARGRQEKEGRYEVMTQRRASKSTRARKNPAGGLTAEGRRYFKRKEGANLKAGVKKSMRDMTPAEMRRKG